jgi:hypothetical protein
MPQGGFVRRASKQAVVRRMRGAGEPPSARNQPGHGFLLNARSEPGVCLQHVALCLLRSFLAVRASGGFGWAAVTPPLPPRLPPAGPQARPAPPAGTLQHLPGAVPVPPLGSLLALAAPGADSSKAPVAWPNTAAAAQPCSCGPAARLALPPKPHTHSLLLALCAERLPIHKALHFPPSSSSVSVPLPLIAAL